MIQEISTIIYKCLKIWGNPTEAKDTNPVTIPAPLFHSSTIRKYSRWFMLYSISLWLGNSLSLKKKGPFSKKKKKDFPLPFKNLPMVINRGKRNQRKTPSKSSHPSPSPRLPSPQRQVLASALKAKKNARGWDQVTNPPGFHFRPAVRKKTYFLGENKNGKGGNP